MWTEERVRDALDKKLERLKDAEHQVDITRNFLTGEVFYKNPEGAASLAQELVEQTKRVEKIKNQIEVLKYILDI